MILNLVNIFRIKNRKKLKEKAKRLVEKDRVLQNKLAKAG